MAELNPPAWMENGSNHARQARLLAAALTNGGVWAAGDLAITTPGGLTVNVAAGGCYVPATASGHGAWSCYNDATATVSVAAGGATNRVDLIVAHVYDSALGDASNQWLLEVVNGTTSAPNPPAVPSNAVKLAEVTINAGSGTITSIADKRVGAYQRFLSPVFKPFKIDQPALSVQGLAGQTGHLLSVLNSAGAELGYFNATGGLVVPTLVVGGGTAVGSGFTAFTPTWTATTTNPALGNGTLSGVYERIGKKVTVNALLTVGSTTTVGSGSYHFALPVAAAASTLPWYGVARYTKASPAAGYPNIAVGDAFVTSSGTTASLEFPEVLTAVSGSQTSGDYSGFSHTSYPAPLAVGDTVAFNLTYEAA